MSVTVESPFQKVVEITRNICMPPQYFDANLLEHVKSVLYTQFSDRCDEELGVLLHVESIDSIENRIAKNSMYAEFVVKFKARVSRPTVDQEFEFRVDQVNANGVFGIMDKMLKVFIPLQHLQGWSFVPDEHNAEHNRFQRATDGASLSVGRWVKARVKFVRFMSDKFGCVSTLRE